MCDTKFKGLHMIFLFLLIVLCFSYMHAVSCFAQLYKAECRLWALLLDLLHL